jgi:hypothetical protein
MVLDGSRPDRQNELDRTLDQLVARQKELEKDVERLKTLEFDQRAVGDGCISFIDSDVDFVGKAAFQVEYLNSPLPSGNESYSQTTIYWSLLSDEQTAMVDLYMRFGPIAPSSLALYNYAFKYSKGGALTQGNLDNQTQWFIGRIPGASNPYESMGQITLPFHSATAFHRAALGDWAGYQLGSALNSREEAGEWKGHFTDPGLGSIARVFSIFPAAGNIEGSVYLYGWCPEMTGASGPDD